MSVCLEVEVLMEVTSNNMLSRTAINGLSHINFESLSQLYIVLLDQN